jgi:1-acyl-sn-glycerol-3-phosphate acyltransferase
VIEGVSPDLPHTDDLTAGPEWSLRIASSLARLVLRVWWRVQVHGAEHVPTRGPVILAANHIGLLDGPVLVAMSQRLTFAMGKHELFVGLGGRILTHIGQISVNRKELDLRAIRRSVQVLRADKVLGVFPEGVRLSGEMAWARGGAAYLAMVTGATVVPVAILGTREPGQTRSQMPRRRRPIHLVFGEPIPVAQQPWPRRKQAVAELTEQLRLRLAAHVVAAQALTGLPLPGAPKPKSVAHAAVHLSRRRPTPPESRAKKS